ncbi:MAG: glycoside hydrolase family 28 protein [Parabacteroides distasonis]|nr:glycoside hydrolase family 28 protein [Parabacteroides distasonis]
MKKNITAFLFACLFLLTATATKAEKIVTVTDMNVVGDGITMNTKAIQKAIDFAHAQKDGGCVVFPKGKYLTGTLVLKSNVTLKIEKDAAILGSTNPYDYYALEETKGKDNSALALIVADKAQNIKIIGEGLIDGNGRELALNIDSLHHIGERIDPNYTTRLNRPNETARPKLFFMSNCDNIHIEGLQLKNSACWGLSFDLCNNLTLKYLNFENRAYWNNDGIDVTDGKHVRISHCFINSADDGICLKSYHVGTHCDDIEISDCEIISSASAVKFGTASWGGFKNIVVRNIKVKDTFRSAIAVECVDGGHIDNVLVENIHAENTGNAIFIRLGHRWNEKPGTLKNVTIRNLFVDIPFGRPDEDYDMRGPALSFFHNPIPSSITGIPGHYVENVTLENIEVLCPGRASKGMAYVPMSRLSSVPENINKYPEFSMFGELPAYGIFVRHVRGLKMKNVQYKLKAHDFRPVYVFDDVEGLVQEE